jgi:hypothetical protein
MCWKQFKCLRVLTSSGDSYWRLTNNSLPAPEVVEISCETFSKLFYNTSVNFGSGQANQTTVILHYNNNTGMPFNMSFYRVVNMSRIQSSGLSTNFPNATIVGWDKKYINFVESLMRHNFLVMFIYQLTF